MYLHSYNILDLVMVPGITTAILSALVLAAPLGWAFAEAVDGRWLRRRAAA